MEQEKNIVKIGYNKKQVRMSLIISGVWMLLWIMALLFSANISLWAGNLVLSLVYFGNYLYLRMPYVTISDTFIKVNGWPPKRILRKDIVNIKYFAGDYTIRSADKKLVIDTNYVDKEDLEQLKGALDPMLQRNSSV